MAASPPLRHVAMLPFMAKGHAMPLLQLSRLLLGRRLASAVTFFTTPRNAPFIRAGLAGASAGAAVVELPFPSEDAPQSTEELPSSTHLVDFVSAVAVLRPTFEDALARLEPRPDLLVHDGFILWAKDIADELGMPRLITLGIGAFASYVSGAVAAHKPHAHVSSPTEPFPVHGLPDLRLTKADLSPPFDEPDPTGPHWDFVRDSYSSMCSSSGIIANSFHELESAYIDLYNHEFHIKIWPIGPLCLAAPEPPAEDVQTKDDREISDWLDSRLAMDRPVLYVAFGSQAELSRAQLEEIAVGVDNSGVDFLWVVRSKWFGPYDDRFKFEERFGERGKVVEGFIDQLRVLRHEAVKGFFTHCGWNSVLESIAMGVPILALPMAAEQKLNAKFVVDMIHMGLRLWPKEVGGLVLSGDVQVLSRELIFGDQGTRAAATAADLSASSRNTMEVGGSSFENLTRMVQEVTQTHACK